jgi:hypothetical protein
MTVEMIEEAREERALGPVTSVQGLGRVREPEEVVALATRMANALKDIVDQKHLYAEIRHKRFPTVEAWETVARFDGVVGREVRVTRQPDGWYEAEADLIRLSDGAVIGHASAICGMPDDAPWNDRPEYARRSMAVTRAMSRAFRQQYAWIMTLAGYEPGVAEEQPREDNDRRRRPGPQRVTLTGTIERAEGDFEPRAYPQGWAILFHLANEDGVTRVILTREKHEELPTFRDGDRVTVEGEWQPRQNAIVTHDAVRVDTPTADLPDAFTME